MTNQHPITPPPELITDWCKQRACISEPGPIHVWLATEAARWGADQELKACCEWASCFNYDDYLYHEVLRDIRRPKPPSLKKQALALLDKAEDPRWDIEDFSIVRKALEALPE